LKSLAKLNGKLFMTILALEFSSPQRSVALARGGIVLSEVVESGGRNTPAFGMIEKVLSEAKTGREEIDVIAVGLGPGSYTGVRAAISIAQGWQLALGTKLLGVGSVEAIATQAQAENIFGRVNVLVDAQRNEFYLATYEITPDGLREIAPLKILSRAEVESRAGADGVLIGPEVTRWFPGGRVIFPRAAMLAELAARRGDFMPGEKLEPIYLRETNFVKAAAVRSIN
jgi:tRNA threonylcarbamoyladenosine biosynthesis protein TsaB